MSEFVAIIMPNFNDFSKVAVDSEIKHQFCICCLCKDVPFIDFTTCEHKLLWQSFFEIKMECGNSLICYYCHTMLKKFASFKHQVIESMDILNGQSQMSYPIHQHSRITNLALSTVISVAILSDAVATASISDKIIKNDNENVGSSNIENLDTEYMMDMDIKIESDVEVPALSSSINEDEELTKSKIIYIEASNNQNPVSEEIDTALSEVTKKMEKSDDKYPGKVISVTLTRDQVLSERENMKTRASYLNLPFKCSSCYVAFETESGYKQHMEKHHSEKQEGFQCDICQSVLTNEASMRRHNTRHYRRYECVVCGERHLLEYSAAAHFNRYHGKMHGMIPLAHQCRICDFTTESHGKYRYHVEKHKTTGKTCEICNYTFKTACSLRGHMQNVHSGNAPVFKCDKCDKEFKSRFYLKSHTCKGVPPNPLAYCALCKKHYMNPLTLKIHLETHSNHAHEKNVICDYCEKRFVSKHAVRNHIKNVHMGVHYRCEKCNKEYKKQSRLKAHIAKVHDKIEPERKEMCQYCGQAFTTSTVLRAHIRIHTGERPYQCDICQDTFAHSGALYTHRRLKHRIQGGGRKKR